jgi:hypothetical protein
MIDQVTVAEVIAPTKEEIMMETDHMKEIGLLGKDGIGGGISTIMKEKEILMTIMEIAGDGELIPEVITRKAVEIIAHLGADIEVLMIYLMNAQKLFFNHDLNLLSFLLVKVVVQYLEVLSPWILPRRREKLNKN